MDNDASPDPYAPPSRAGTAAPQLTAPQPYGYGGAPSGPQPYGWPGGPYAYGPPPRPQGTNGFAIAGLVLGILPVLLGILGIVFGALGLKQTKRTGQNGRGMALAGIVLGSLWVVLFAVLITVAIVTDSDKSSSTSASSLPPTSPSAGFDGPHLYDSSHDPSAPDAPGSSSGDTESAFLLKPGECLRNTPSGEVRQIDVVPCSQRHTVEAYASFQLTGSSFPGDSRMTALSESGCNARFPAYVGTSYENSSLDVYYLHPTRESWTYRDDREVTCLVGSGSPTTGSLRNSRR